MWRLCLDGFWRRKGMSLMGIQSDRTNFLACVGFEDGIGLVIPS